MQGEICPALTNAGRRIVTLQDRTSSANQPSIALQLVQVSRPVILEQARERPIGEDTALGLATGAVVGLVVGVADPLQRYGADRAVLAITAMYGHLRTECGNFPQEVVTCLKAKPIGPFPEHELGSVEQPPDITP